jgi:(p)ppGpp synthase/HD superfamily hydrolase
MIARAEIVARIAHQGQVDKAGVDYSEHLKAVAALTAAAIDPSWRYRNEAIAAAWLHDTVEDTPLSLNDLRELGFSKVVVNAVGLLTQDSRDSHADYVRRIRDADGIAGTVARFVKLADLKHNSDPTRSTWMPPDKLRARYEKALAIMSEREA